SGVDGRVGVVAVAAGPIARGRLACDHLQVRLAPSVAVAVGVGEEPGARPGGEGVLVVDAAVAIVVQLVAGLAGVGVDRRVRVVAVLVVAPGVAVDVHAGIAGVGNAVSVVVDVVVTRRAQVAVVRDAVPVAVETVIGAGTAIAGIRGRVAVGVE